MLEDNLMYYQCTTDGNDVVFLVQYQDDLGGIQNGYLELQQPMEEEMNQDNFENQQQAEVHEGDQNVSKIKKIRKKRKSKKVNATSEPKKSRRPKKRSRKGKSDPKKWFRNAQHEKRIHGQEYEGRNGMIRPGVIERHMEKCGCIFRCEESFNEESQKRICNEYYAAGKPDSFISTNVLEKQIFRSRPRKNYPKKIESKSREYYLPRNENEAVRVCQRFFCFVLQISFRIVDAVMKQKTPNGFLIPRVHGSTNVKAKNATPEDVVQIVKDHINSFPRIPSHYCRQSSTKLYLSPELNIATMYHLYTDHCTNILNVKPVNAAIYRRIFSEFEPQLSFYKPKKDLCTLCEMRKDSLIQHSESFLQRYNQHKEFEKTSLTMKAVDMANKESWHRCITFDMEANLQIPFAGDCQIYYKRKLSMFNFTIYDNTASGYCYLFDECNGSKGANEVATCILNYFQNKLPPSVTHLTTYSDTCAAQSRNSYFISMMIYAVNQHPTLQRIYIKYLESGHSYLECDSMHSAIERRMRKRKVYNPSEMRIIMEDARRNPKPYTIKLMKFSDFLNFKAVPLLTPQTKDAEKNKVHWLQVKRIDLIHMDT